MRTGSVFTRCEQPGGFNLHQTLLQKSYWVGVKNNWVYSTKRTVTVLLQLSFYIFLIWSPFICSLLRTRAAAAPEFLLMGISKGISDLSRALGVGHVGVRTHPELTLCLPPEALWNVEWPCDPTEDPLRLPDGRAPSRLWGRLLTFCVTMRRCLQRRLSVSPWSGNPENVLSSTFYRSDVTTLFTVKHGLARYQMPWGMFYWNAV